MLLIWKFYLYLASDLASPPAASVSSSARGSRVPGQSPVPLGCSERRAVEDPPWARGGAGRGVGGGPGGVTWRVALAKAEVAAPALEGVRCRECPEPGRRASARGTLEPGPAAGTRPGGWHGQVGGPAGRELMWCPENSPGRSWRGQASLGERRLGPRPLC